MTCGSTTTLRISNANVRGYCAWVFDPPDRCRYESTLLPLYPQRNRSSSQTVRYGPHPGGSTRRTTTPFHAATRKGLGITDGTLQSLDDGARSAITLALYVHTDL